ncbi:Arsenate-mycothiol transferase ArsC1 [Corynebacterium ciconiae DSM 44920]|uniref:arsenate-mycothiol transferase ArsC n=1 Tax=Corynebacterium ciconiae TaxID=227319 RepID=UPI00035D996D|nr:low molecular weight phosphatase family protein [Corynebacterium ciconiae]WKD60166.1 Arsenate-mycothiol transferase ArsC1 [Corynebacterium ciconiae DSM 44920]
MKSTPTVLFVCVANAGKSQMAAALARLYAGDALRIYSAGTEPKEHINQLSAKSVAELGADMTGATPQPVDPTLLESVDRTIILGEAAQLRLPAHAQGSLERWSVCEPANDGIEGAERMALIRDDIAARVRALIRELLSEKP